ncbi:MAG TPA: bifunctional hydroxymethylpyrimidine kinase/phosphomethylpyrimidine kinase [Chloroflexota bacterium]|nr:bifunctional hydroxymethylpyrimidine kinase/phosphomethylpyrimidine kinase [Chloroflexota bacterium]
MKTALTIAGSDSGGGAGIQADLKTFSALGVFGTSAITAITAQNTVGVTAIQELPPALIAAQIDAVLSDIGADVVKTGMLSSQEIITVVAERLRHHGVRNLVVDPVMVAKSGDRLLRIEAVSAYKDLILPISLVVTPNLGEAEELVGRTLSSDEDIRKAAAEIHAMGTPYVVMKGGHRPGEDVVDVLFDGKDYVEFRARRVQTTSTHGTGCTFASALAAGLARGMDISAAVHLAKIYITRAVENAPGIGRGHGPVHHFFAFPLWTPAE